MAVTTIGTQQTPTSSFVAKSVSTPPVCRSLQTFQSKPEMSPAANTTPPISVTTLRSQLRISAPQSSIPPSSSSVESTVSLPQPRPAPVPMSATPPSTCIRPKVLSPVPQTPVSAASGPGSTAGIRLPRPSQPLPPVRTSSCPTKAAPVSKEVYEKVRMHEPDLNRRPARSALKGSKSTGAQTFQQQLEKVLNSSQRFAAGCHRFPTAADNAADAVAGGVGLSRSRSGDCGKLAAKLLPAVAPKPRLLWVYWHFFCWFSSVIYQFNLVTLSALLQVVVYVRYIGCVSGGVDSLWQ